MFAFSLNSTANGACLNLSLGCRVLGGRVPLGNPQSSQFTGIIMTTISNTPRTFHMPSSPTTHFYRDWLILCYNFVKQIIIPILQLRKLRLDEVWQPVRGRHTHMPKLSGPDSDTLLPCSSCPALVYHPLFLTVFRRLMLAQPSHCLDGRFPFSTAPAALLLGFIHLLKF